MYDPKRDLVAYFNIQHCPSLYTKKNLEKNLYVKPSLSTYD